MYPMNTNYQAIETVVAQMTAKGRETMKAVGNHELSFFDDGIVEYSGIWGECLVSEMGHKSSGVVNRLRDLGLWIASDQGDDSVDAGLWWSLTALGADVANYLAGQLENQADAEEQMAPEAEAKPVVTTKVGPKWSYIYVDGVQVAEVRSNLFDAVLVAITASL